VDAYGFRIVTFRPAQTETAPHPVLVAIQNEQNELYHPGLWPEFPTLGAALRALRGALTHIAAEAARQRPPEISLDTPPTPGIQSCAPDAARPYVPPNP